ncbi:MED30 [Bugula neritina]|uniref:Mediator of RNA polymerase II transcription subunit 30 n=1 Tax=Bugula neritina TaxID=10212 RepID=A0A7J7JCC5_BUGNE|nr:MED30 [Bugula neritina]
MNTFMMDEGEAYNVNSSAVGVNKVKTSNGTYAYIMESAALKYAIVTDPELLGALILFGFFILIVEFLVGSYQASRDNATSFGREFAKNLKFLMNCCENEEKPAVWPPKQLEDSDREYNDDLYGSFGKLSLSIVFAIMQHNVGKPKISSSFGDLSSHQQPGNSPLFSPGARSIALNSLQSQSSTETNIGEQNKDLNLARHCRLGQDYVHEIVQKAADVFQNLKGTQLPNHLATNHATYNDRKKNLQESLKTVIDHFRRLKVVYNTVENVSQTMDLKPAKELIPFVDERPSTDKAESSMEVDSQSESYKMVLAEHSTLTEQLKMKNVQLKEIIDQLRNLLWEINTTMSLKNSKP